jgi:hypothetical protein
MSHQTDPLAAIRKLTGERATIVEPGKARITHRRLEEHILYVADAKAPGGYRYYVSEVTPATEFTNRATFSAGLIQALVSSGASYTDRPQGRNQVTELRVPKNGKPGRRHPQFNRVPAGSNTAA